MCSTNLESARENRIALLIDAENIAPKYAERIFEELNKYGDIIIRRIYGDWSNNNVRSWMDISQQYAMKLVMQENNISGKNASDICLVIDAMKLLHEKRTEVFCIVSSDSDFTLLAKEIRENGVTVIGMGEDKTSETFIRACKRFILLDRISEDEADNALIENEEKSSITDKKLIEKAITEIVVDNIGKGKKSYLGEIGSRLSKMYPEFDSRNYGYHNLSAFIKSMDNLKMRGGANNMFLELDTLGQNEMKTAIVGIFHEFGDCMNIGLLNQKLKERVRDVDSSIKASGASKFSKYLEMLPYVEFVDQNRVRLKNHDQKKA